MNELSSLIHSPIRLQIMAYLSRVEQSEYERLREVLDIDAPSLSRQLKVLADAGFVNLFKKSPRGKTQAVALSVLGEKKFREYKKALDHIVQGPKG
ncbi:transcriptional regulator [Corynebacterium sp. p3-SID1241]|jgi:DNA-binding transcriptional ArsR family regulator|uniref:transcriptional regulator n=1 Tax=Corynebacterium TaxID=1716 RepID=UPI0037BECDED